MPTTDSYTYTDGDTLVDAERAEADAKRHMAEDRSDALTRENEQLRAEIDRLRGAIAAIRDDATLRSWTPADERYLDALDRLLKSRSRT